MTSIAKLPALAFPAPTTETISTGVITIDQHLHIVAAESGTADTLVTMNNDFDSLAYNGVDYWPVVMLIADSGDTITIEHGSGNFDLPSDTDITLTDDCWLAFIHNGTNWQFWAG